MRWSGRTNHNHLSRNLKFKEFQWREHFTESIHFHSLIQKIKGGQPINQPHQTTHQSTTQRQKVVFCWIECWIDCGL